MTAANVLAQQLREIRAQAVKCPVYSRGLAVAYTVHLPPAALELLEQAAGMIEDAPRIDGMPHSSHETSELIPAQGCDDKTPQTCVFNGGV